MQNPVIMDTDSEVGATIYDSGSVDRKRNGGGLAVYTFWGNGWGIVALCKFYALRDVARTTVKGFGWILHSRSLFLGISFTLNQLPSPVLMNESRFQTLTGMRVPGRSV